MHEFNYGHVAVFLFIILPFLIAMYAIFKLAFGHISDLKKQAERLKTKSIQENSNAPIY